MTRWEFSFSDPTIPLEGYAWPKVSGAGGPAGRWWAPCPASASTVFTTASLLFRPDCGWHRRAVISLCLLPEASWMLVFVCRDGRISPLGILLANDMLTCQASPDSSSFNPPGSSRVLRAFLSTAILEWL